MQICQEKLFFTLIFKICRKDFCTSFAKNSAQDFRSVIKPRGVNVKCRTEGSETVISGTINHSLYTGVYDCTCTHNTGLHSNVKGYSGKSPTAKSLASSLNRQNFGMMSGTPGFLTCVECRSNDFSVTNRNCSDRNLVTFGSEKG